MTFHISNWQGPCLPSHLSFGYCLPSRPAYLGASCQANFPARGETGGLTRILASQIYFQLQLQETSNATIVMLSLAIATIVARVP